MVRTKDIALQAKDVDGKKGIVTFYIAAFDNKDSDGDIIEKGAATKSIHERGPKSTGNEANRIKHLKNHNTTQAPGKVLELYEDHKGVVMVSQLSKSSLGQDTLIEYEEGIITEHSIGFETINEKFDKDAKVNVIKELKLWEGSSLTAWGANHQTPTVGVKQLKELDYIELIADLEQRLKVGRFSDQYLEKLENSLKSLTAQYHSMKPEPSTSEPEAVNKFFGVFDSKLFKN